MSRKRTRGTTTHELVARDAQRAGMTVPDFVRAEARARDAGTVAVDVEEVRTLIGELTALVVTGTKLVATMKDTITSGRQLQRDLRHDVARYKGMIERDVEKAYEDKVQEAIKELGVILNTTQVECVKSVIAEFRELRDALMSNRSPEEMKMILSAIGNGFAVKDAYVRGDPEARAVVDPHRFKKTVPLKKTETVTEQNVAEHLLFHS